MSNNTLMKVVQKIPRTCDKETVYSHLHDVLAEVDSIYSVIVYYDKDSDMYTVQYNLSQIDRFNTLHSYDVASAVVKMLEEGNMSKKVVGYMQPPIEICLEVFNPLVVKLAKQQRARWRCLEEEDYEQICRLVMIRLHQKNYYLNKRLIEKAFNNEVLMTLRSERNAPVILSFEDTFYTPLSSSSEKLLVADVVEDVSIKEEEERLYVEEAEKAIFNEVKALVIDLIGERQWNELVRAYTNGCTDSWSQKKMHDVKLQIKKLGLSRKDFNNKYYG